MGKKLLKESSINEADAKDEWDISSETSDEDEQNDFEHTASTDAAHTERGAFNPRRVISHWSGKELESYEKQLDDALEEAMLAASAKFGVDMKAMKGRIKELLAEEM